jgi:uncharacterized membrane protein
MKRPWLIVVSVTVIMTAILEIAYRHHAHAAFWWHRTPVFDFVYGLAGCASIVLISKWLGHVWLQRHEDYYGDDPS